MPFSNKTIRPERWRAVPRFQQLGHIGSELSRARSWERQQDTASRDQALCRALDLLDETLDDPRWARRRKELARLREAVSDHVAGCQHYEIALEELEIYCSQFLIRQGGG